VPFIVSSASNFDSLCEIQSLPLIDPQIVSCAADAFMPEQVLTGGEILHGVLLPARVARSAGLNIAAEIGHSKPAFKEAIAIPR
jgi:hypothetical protein